MKSRIIFVLTTLVLIFGINKFTLRKDVNKLIENINTVNISGKQRMYSQKISKQALFYLKDIKNITANNANLNKSVQSFSAAHNKLKNDLSRQDDDYLNDLFKELDPYFIKIVENVNELTSKNLSTDEIIESVNKISSSANNFLPIMDSIVGQYETVGRERGEIVLQRELTFNIILIVLFTYSLIFIIIPAIRTFDESEKFSFF